MLSDDELPPLPNKEKLHTVLPDDYRYGHIYGYTADQMREYARAVERAAYERAAQECEKLIKRTPEDRWDHGYDLIGKALADAIRALGRQHD